VTPALWVLLAASRTVDFAAAAVVSHPERFSLCVAAHPVRPVEIDLCSGLDRGLTALTSHVFARKGWSWRSLEVALGLGAGGRVSSWCPVAACAVAFGPEALASLEAVWWLADAFGLSLQLDGGVAVVWAQAGPGLYEPGLRFPARLLFGVAL